MYRNLALVLVCVSLFSSPALAAETSVRIAVFQADITPPIGSPLCFGFIDPAKEIVDPLTARGIVLLTGDKPIVLCAVDWVEICNGGHDAFREVLAKAAGTTADRVCVQTLHQHDAPGVDFTADALLTSAWSGQTAFDSPFAKMAMQRTAEAVKSALEHPQTITHVGTGKGRVEKVASNRRVLGPDGKKVVYVRYSSAKDEIARTSPEGVIDPYVQLISFWNGERPVAALTYYATHPQSYYGKGGVSADFPGMARRLREAALPGVAMIHFCGAGGNVTAGKYNDGSPGMRPVLAERLAAGMKAAWDDAKKVPLQAGDVAFRTLPVALPVSKLIDAEKDQRVLADEKSNTRERIFAAVELAWHQRCAAGHKIDLSCLRVGPAYVLHTPGELFVEYQLAAQKLRPGSPVCMAAYGDCGMGYIGTAEAYPQGGYETSRVSRVAPEVETVLTEAIAELLK